jgi:hypothetical protein
VETEIHQYGLAVLSAIGPQWKQLMAIAARSPTIEDIESILFQRRQYCRLIVHQEAVYAAR